MTVNEKLERPLRVDQRHSKTPTECSRCRPELHEPRMSLQGQAHAAPFLQAAFSVAARMREARAVAPGSSRTGTAPKAWESGDPKQSVGAIRLGAVQPPEAAIHAPSGGVESMPGRY